MPGQIGRTTAKKIEKTVTMSLSIDLFSFSFFFSLDGPAGYGRVPGGGEGTAGVLREEVRGFSILPAVPGDVRVQAIFI